MMHYADLLEITKERLADQRCYPPVKYASPDAVFKVGSRLHAIMGECTDASCGNPRTERQKHRFLRDHGVRAIAHVLTMFGSFPGDEILRLRCLPWVTPPAAVKGTKEDRNIWHTVAASDFHDSVPDFRAISSPDSMGSFAVLMDDQAPLLLTYKMDTLKAEHTTALSEVAADLGDFALWVTDYQVESFALEPEVTRIQPPLV